MKITHRKLKEEYLHQVKGLRNILNEWDFIGIYPSLGGPEDEYDCLINPIISKLKTNITNENLVFFLEKEFEDHFGISPPKFTKISDVAEKIITWWEQKKQNIV